MTIVQQTLGQLSFDVLDPDDSDTALDETIPEPSLATFQFSGKLMSYQNQRGLGRRLEVRLIDPRSGEVIARSRAKVMNVQFPFHEQTEKTDAWTERAHAVKIGDAIREDEPR